MAAWLMVEMAAMFTTLLFSAVLVCAEPASDYDAALNRLETAAKEANRSVSRETVTELRQAIEHIRDFSRDLAADPNGRELRGLALLSLSRLYINTGETEEAAEAMDQAIFAAGADPLPVDRFGPDIEKLYEKRQAALEQRGRADIEVLCPVPCGVYIDGNAVQGQQFDLYLGPHLIHVTSDSHGPVTANIELGREGAIVDYEVMLPEKPDAHPSEPTDSDLSEGQPSAGKRKDPKGEKAKNIEPRGAQTSTAVVWGRAAGPIPRWKLIAVGVSGGMTLVTLGTGIGLSISISPYGSWRRDLLAAVQTSLTDESTTNDVNPAGEYSGYSYCGYANIRPDVSSPSLVLNKDVSQICQDGDKIEDRASAMYVWAGASAAVTLVFGLLINTRRIPVSNDVLAAHQASLSFAPTLDGGMMAVGSFRF